ncbi:MAG: hypothetical protein ACYC1U_09320 [Candidatus Aquicultorales bacterium]
MEVSESQAEAAAVKAEMMKESLAERLEFLAGNLDKSGAALAERLRDLTGSGAHSLSLGLRSAARMLRRTKVAEMLSPTGDSKEKQAAMTIAAGLGAGLALGLIVRRMVR